MWLSTTLFPLFLIIKLVAGARSITLVDWTQKSQGELLDCAIEVASTDSEYETHVSETDLGGLSPELFGVLSAKRSPSIIATTQSQPLVSQRSWQSIDLFSSCGKGEIYCSHAQSLSLSFDYDSIPAEQDPNYECEKESLHSKELFDDETHQRTRSSSYFSSIVFDDAPNILYSEDEDDDSFYRLLNRNQPIADGCRDISSGYQASSESNNVV